MWSGATYLGFNSINHMHMMFMAHETSSSSRIFSIFFFSLDPFSIFQFPRMKSLHGIIIQPTKNSTWIFGISSWNSRPFRKANIFFCFCFVFVLGNPNCFSLWFYLNIFSHSISLYSIFRMRLVWAFVIIVEMF